MTFGITPTHPETGYGYIRCEDQVDETYTVAAFVEKSASDVAAEYIAAGGYFWNSGIFMFRATRYLEELLKFQPEMFQACQDAFAGKQADLDFLRFDEDAFLACPANSIDYAVMEKTEDAVVVPLDAGWSDIGSWSALSDVSTKDAAGNCEIGDVVNIDGFGNYINASSRLVTAVGCKNLVIVETKDAVFVAPKAKVSDVKKLVETLISEGRTEVVSHREVYRPWGKYDSVDAGERYQVKRITVNPGAELSVQKHFHRAEHWVIVRGTAKVTKGNETILLSENQSTYIPIGTVHKLENPGKVPLELIEIQSGSYLGEDDIVRLEDNYGRK